MDVEIPLEQGDNVYRKLHPARGKWKEIAHRLGLSDGTIQEIDERFTEPEKALNVVINEWLNGKDDAKKKGITWSTIKRALKHKSVNEKELATTIEAIQPAPDADDTILKNDSSTVLTVLNETHSIADWSSLSILLGIDNAAMQRIRQNKPGDALDQQKAIIMAWLNTGKASWAILVGALRHKIVGRAADGDRIAKAYPRGAKLQQPKTSDPTVQPTAESPSPTPKKELNRKVFDEYKLRIDNLTQEHKFAHAKGIIFVVGIFGADGTAEDMENITSTFKELKFAVFSERDLTAEKIACLVAAAAECKFPYKYRYIAFYFAGHGGTDESGEPFIRGLQTDASKKENLHIHDFIVTPWKGLQLARLFLFDCCQSADSGTAFHGDNDVVKKKRRAYPGEVVAFALNTGKKASGNVTRGGVWTHYLCKNLRKPLPITTVLALTFGDVRKVQEDFQEPVSHATIGALMLCEDDAKKEYEAAVAKAMEEGEGDLVQSNIVLHGPPGAGKSSVKRLIIGLPPLPKEKHTATDIVENAVRAISTSQMKHFKVIKNVELIGMIANEVDSHKPQIKEEEKHSNNQTKPEASRNEPLQSTAKPAPVSTTVNIGSSLQSDKGSLTPQVSLKAASIQSIRDRLSEARGPVKIYDSHWHHVVDSGGQPQFQDILPLVYRNPSFNIVVVQLTDRLDTKPKVCFYEKGQNVYTLPNHLAPSNRQSIVSICQMAASQANLGDVAPYVMIVGTHKDMLGRNSEAKIREWNQGLAGIKEEFGNVLISKSGEEIIFDVNTMAPEGAERQEYTKKLQECITAVTEKHASPVKVPLRWLAYQLDLDKGEGVVRISECNKTGEGLGMRKEDVNFALQFFTKVAMIFYFPEDIPDLVLTKMDPFIGKLSKLVKASFVPPTYCSAEESSKLRKKGLFHKSFLAIAFQDMKTDILQDEEFLKLLECLKIAVHVGEGEYFLPSALSLEPSSNEFTYKMHSVPLVFSWGERILPHGFFFTVAVELLSRSNEKGDIRFDLRTDIAQCREEIQMKTVHGEIPGVVKLINRTRWIQVCSSSSAVFCPTIYKAVNTAVEKTVQRFEHTGIGYPTVTVLCPIEDHDGHETKDHYCILSADEKWFSCTSNQSRTGSVTPEMLCWTQGTEPSSSTIPTTVTAGDVFHLLKPKSCDWQKIGRGLKVKYNFRQGILKEGMMTSNEDKLEAVLNNWIETHCSEVSWDNLIQVLTELEFIDIVQDVRSFLQQNQTDPKTRNVHTHLMRNVPSLRIEMTILIGIIIILIGIFLYLCQNYLFAVHNFV